MSLFRALPPIRMGSGSVVIWYTEEKPRARRLGWITERLESVAAGSTDDSVGAVFVYGDCAVAWFDIDRLHYIPRPGPLYCREGSVSPSEVALTLHQAVARTGSVPLAVAELAR